ncbi:hypothetical protein [Saccharomonospora iraqiensis]|uniref:hypothetical protein n=1 Tax=Saccharomonospora iraqiensis TaxID=52698 RepID=UPI0012B5508C|nr:hypothetical protein [Saccharomonospora iraqiensis]
MEVDLETFIISGEFGSVGSGSEYGNVATKFGEPELLEAQHRSRPMIARYGDVEFRFLDQLLIAISVNLPDREVPRAANVELTGLWPPSARTLETVGKLLRKHGISWQVDPVMSATNPEENSQTWVTDRKVHLGFFAGYLHRITAEHAQR